MGIDYFSKLQSKLDTTTTKGGYFSSIDPKNNVKDTGSQRPVNSFVANGNEVADSQDYNKPDTTVTKPQTTTTKSTFGTPRSTFGYDSSLGTVPTSTQKTDFSSTPISKFSFSRDNKVENTPEETARFNDTLKNIKPITVESLAQSLEKVKSDNVVASVENQKIERAKPKVKEIAEVEKLNPLSFNTKKEEPSFGGKVGLTLSKAGAGYVDQVAGVGNIAMSNYGEDKLTGFTGNPWKEIKKTTENTIQQIDSIRGVGSTKVEDYIMQTMDQVLQQLPAIAAGLATGGLSVATKIPSTVAATKAITYANNMIKMSGFGASAAIGYTNEALGRGESLNKSLLYGTYGALIEMNTEMIPFNLTAGLLTGTALKGMAKKGGKVAATFGLKYLESIAANIVQEGVTDPAINVGKMAILGEKFPNILGKDGIIDPAQMLKSGLSGGAVALILGGGGFITTAAEMSKVSKMNKMEAAKELIDTLSDKVNASKIQDLVLNSEADTEQAPVQDTNQVVDVNKKVAPVSAEIAQTETGTETSPVVAKTAPTQTGAETAQVEEEISLADEQVKAKVETKTISQIAEQTFGTTTNLKEAGYILEDGKMLDFSGKRDGGAGNTRDMDHREVQSLYSGLGQTESMNQFLEDTNAVRIGVTDDSANIDIVGNNLTEKQIAKIVQATMKKQMVNIDYYKNAKDNNPTKTKTLNIPLASTVKNAITELTATTETEPTTTYTPTTQEIAKVEQSVKDLTLALEASKDPTMTVKDPLMSLYGGLIDKSATKFLDAKLKKHQKLLQELLAKKVTKESITEVKKLMRVKNTIADLKAEFEGYKTAQKEVAEKSKERARMTKKTTKLKDAATDLKKNSKQMYPHYKAMAEEILDLLDIKAKSISTKKLMSLTKSQEFFAKEKKSDPSYEIPERMKAELERLGKQSISSMTESEIDILQTAIDHITNQNKLKGMLIAGQNKRRVDKVIASMQESLDKAKKLIDGDTKLKSNEKSLIQYFIKTSSLSTENMALKLSGFDASNPAFEVLYTNLTEGQRTMIEFELDAQRDFKEAEKTLDISTNREEVNLADTTLKMTGWEKISLYLHTQNADNILHLKNGGIRFDKYAKVYKLTQADVDSIKKTLSKDELAYAELVNTYFNSTSRKALNEVSVKLLGYEIATIENYFPIVTDSLYKEKDFNKQFQKLLIEQQSFLKQRTHGDNTIRLEDVRKTKNRSISGTGKYYGMAIPLRDAKMLLGDKEIKQSIAHKFGTSQQKYYDKLWSDIEGYTSEVDPAESKLIKVQKNLQQAIIGLNPGILLNQLASFPTAFAELNPLDLISTNGLKPNISFDLMKKYSPIIEYRMQGHVTRETGEAMLSERMRWTTKGVTFFDSIAIAKIWNVVEAEIKRTNPDIKYKSDEYYEKVARRTEEVIYRTQPNYTLMQRSAIQRSDNFVARTLSFFSTQRNQNYNILYRSLMTYNKTPVESTKAILSVATGTLVVALVRSLRHKWRKEDDDFLDNYIGSTLGNLYLVGDVYDLITKNYGIENPAIESLNQLVTYLNAARNPDSTASAAGNTVKIIGSLAQLAGIPLKNFLQEFGTIIQHTNPELYDIWTEFQTKTGSVGTLNTRIRVIEKEIEEGNYTNSADLELYKEFKKAITDLKSEYKKEIKTPYAEANVEIPKATIKAYEDYYKEIAKSALGR